MGREDEQKLLCVLENTTWRNTNFLKRQLWSKLLRIWNIWVCESRVFFNVPWSLSWWIRLISNYVEFSSGLNPRHVCHQIHSNKRGLCKSCIPKSGNSWQCKVTILKIRSIRYIVEPKTLRLVRNQENYVPQMIT